MAKEFFKSLKPALKALDKKLKKYRIEIFLLITALITASISLFIFLSSNNKNEEEIISENKVDLLPEKILVDIQGAVEKPDVYEVSSGARLKDVLILAGGLSAEADRVFFSRRFNLAKKVADQEKYYIPSIEEVQTGLIKESEQTLNYNQTGNQEGSNQSSLININTASIEELDQLPGIGKVTAQKIIQNRPYQNIEELATKKIVNKSVYEKIKNLITAN